MAVLNSGIYKVTNTVNNKIYIGSSINIKRRFTAHKYHLNNNSHKNSHLQSAYNKYGEEVFEFSILEYCPTEVLLSRELDWITILNTLDSKCGYNKDVPKGNNLGYIQGVRTIELKRMAAFKQVAQYSATGELIKVWNSIKEAATFFNVHNSNITRCCKGERQLKVKGYVWRYKEDAFNLYRTNSISTKGRKQTEQHIKNRTKHGVSLTTRQKLSIANKGKKPSEAAILGTKLRQSKPIIAIDDLNNYMEFCSIREAAKQLNINQKSITTSIKVGKLCKKITFKYK